MYKILIKKKLKIELQNSKELNKAIYNNFTTKIIHHSKIESTFSP